MLRCHILVALLLFAAAVRGDDSLKNAILAACRQPGNALREGHCSFLSGMAAIESQNVDAARLHLEEAGRHLEAAGDPVAAWKALWVLAEYERRFGRRPDLKLAILEKTLAFVERAKRLDAPFRLDEELREILSGPPLAPDSIYSRTLQFFEAVSRDGYAAALIAVGELEQAETQLEIASQLAGPFGAMLDRSIARNRGDLRRRQWRLNEARESYQQALAAPKIRRPFTIDDRQEGDAAALYGLAEIETLGGRTDEALRWNDRSLALVRAAGEQAAELSVLGHRATILERGRRLAAAEQVYADALSIAKANGNVKGQASLLVNRASMYQDHGRYGAAFVDSEKSLELLTTIDDPLLESAVLAQVAGMYLNFAAHESATSAIEKARGLAGKSGSLLVEAMLDVVAAFNPATLPDLDRAIDRLMQRPEVREIEGMKNMPRIAALLRAATGPNPAADLNAVDRSGLALEGWGSDLLNVMALVAQGRSLAAREVAMFALARNPTAELRAILLSLIAATYAGEGQWERCIDYGTTALDAEFALHAGLADTLLSGFLSQKRTMFDILIEAFVLTNRVDQAFEVTERARARAFLQLVGNRRIRPRSDADSHIVREVEALRTQIARWQQEARITPSKTLDNDLRGARLRYSGLTTRLKASDPEYASIAAVEVTPLESIRAELPGDTTLLSYFVSGGRVQAWVLDRTMLEHVRLPVDDAWIDSATCALRQFGQSARGVRVPNVSCNATTFDAMYERLFAPLRKHVRNKRLIIVPHLRLHYLPFGAFRDPVSQRYLIEDYTITYAPSASVIRFLREKETPVNGRALVLGAPAGVSPKLPGALREAMIVGAELRSVPMVGAAARESLLYQLNGEIDLVHIAAHGFYEAETPLFSRVALTEGDGSDGNLEVHEILSDVNLTGVNLVVLSACQTALGKGSAGDDIVGLTRALLFAGTPGVISTLWDIPDDTTVALMNHFYCRLLSGDSAADALRHAQLQLLHGNHPDPRQWAAFTLNGNPEGRWNTSGAIAAAEN